MKRFPATAALILAAVVFVTPLSSQERGEALLSRGIESYNSGVYNAALQSFREVILDTRLNRYHGDGYFWIAKTYIALGRLEDASENLEFYIMNFPDNRYYSEATYQKGRLLYLQREYESAVTVLEGFVREEVESPFRANGYFWIGESLYSLGHFSEAQRVYNVILTEYPTSFKVEAARYRISIIELKDREQELLKLLKWSHEESLKTIEDFQRRERTYEQALESYQKRLSAMTGLGGDDEVQRLSDKLGEREIEIAGYESRILSLESRITELETALTKSPETVTIGPSREEIEAAAEAVIAEERAKIASVMELLELKESALALKERILDSKRSTE